MNRITPSKRQLVEAGNAAADRLVALVGACEWCSCTYGGLAQHEIANAALRRKARLEPWASIVVCNECHITIHRMPMPERTLIALAILYHSRSADYDLRKFVALVSPHAPQRFTQREVDLWIRRLAA